MGVWELIGGLGCVGSRGRCDMDCGLVLREGREGVMGFG